MRTSNFAWRMGRRCSFGRMFGLVMIRLPFNFQAYMRARNRQAKAKCYMVQNGEQIHWGPIFKRDLTLFEERELFSLLDTVDQVACLGEGQAKTQKKTTTKPEKKIQTGTPQPQGSEGTQRDTTTSSH